MRSWIDHSGEVVWEPAPSLIAQLVETGGHAGTAGEMRESARGSALRRDRRCCAVSCGKRGSHLQENLDAQDLDLTPEDVQSIDSLVPENAAA